MINENFVILGAFINLIGTLTYLIAAIKGKVKPNKVTWLLWAVIPFIAFTAQVRQGVGLQALLTFMVGFGPLLIFIASFFSRKAYWKIGRLDITCGVLSLLGMALWYVTEDANIAIALAILADGLAGLPTVVKAYHAPETEDSKIYISAAISAAITLLTIRTWTFAYYGFAAYILGMTLLLAALVILKPGRTLHKF